MTIIENFELKDITSFHLSAKAKLFVEYDNINDFINFHKGHRNVHFMHIGGGCNLVFKSDFEGIIAHSQIKYITKISESDTDVILKVGAGVIWDEFVKYCVDSGYYGIENMSYIPGEVGASAIQNIGSYGVEVKDVISKVYTISLDDYTSHVFENHECKYGYRDSIFKNEYKDKYVVTAVEYKLSKLKNFNLSYGALKNLEGDKLSLRMIRDEIIKIRTSKLPDPAVLGNVGSFFKNPVVDEDKFNELYKLYPNMPYYTLENGLIKIPAGWLIENSGLKGYAIGGAKVYEKQCLVLVNCGYATPSDVVALYTYIIKTVDDKYGIILSPEANII